MGPYHQSEPLEPLSVETINGVVVKKYPPGFAIGISPQKNVWCK
jgi:hypothetical protein